MCQTPRPRPDIRVFFSNLTGPRPWPEKIRLLLRNNWLKIKHLQDCCGHPGEPGC